jgi:predicted DNA-binding WGR domain protein
MANGNKKIYTWSITKTKKNTVKRTKGLVGDKSKTVQLVDKEYQSEEAAKNFIKKAIEKKRADGFVKKKSVTTATKNASKKASSNKKRKSRAAPKKVVPKKAKKAAATTKTVGISLDPAVSSMSRSVGNHGSVVGDYHAYCTFVDAAKNTNKEYRIQLVQAQGRFYLFKRWGRIGTGGQCSLTPEGGNPNVASLVKEFSRVFKSKTGVAWDQRGSSVAVRGKYQQQMSGPTAAAATHSELGTNDPDHAAHQLALRGLFDEGITFARIAVDRSPNSSTSLSNLGYYSLARRAFAEAEVMLRRAVDMPGASLIVFANLGLCLALRGGCVVTVRPGCYKFSNEVTALIAQIKGEPTLTLHQGAVWQYRNNLAKSWQEDADDDETGKLANDVAIVRAFATALE